MRRLLLIFISLFIGCYSFAQKTTIKIEMEKSRKTMEFTSFTILIWI